LIQRVDVDALIQRVDIVELTGRIQLGSMVTRSTTGIVMSLLDLLRRQMVGLDVVILRIVDRILRRPPGSLPTSPNALLAAVDAGEPAGRVSGRYVGPASRLLAFGIDIGVVTATYAITTAVIAYVVKLLFNHTVNQGGWWWTALLAAWWFVYLWGSWGAFGRTVGMGMVGLRIVSSDGPPITQRQALVRVLVFPFSFLLFGLGFAMALVQRQRRALHDLAAKTCVVYDWGDDAAEMPAPLTRWLSRRGALAGAGAAPPA